MKTARAFTLIELLVVISIIALLASVVLVSLNNARYSAQLTKARSDIMQIVHSADLARLNLNEPLMLVTGSNCSYCSGESAIVAALKKIGDASGGLAGIENIRNDPWGGTYQLDENETEGGSTNCTRDQVWASNGDARSRYLLEYQTTYCLQHPVGTAGWQSP